MSKLNLNLLKKPVNQDQVTDQATFFSKITQPSKGSKYVEDNLSYKQLSDESAIELNSLSPPISQSQASFSQEAQQDSSVNLSKRNLSEGDNIVLPYREEQDLNSTLDDQPPPQLKRKTSQQSQSKTKTSKKDKKDKKDKTKKQYKYKHVPFKWDTYRFLLNYPKKHWQLTLLVNLLIIVTSILGVYLPMLMGQLLDATTKQNDEELHKKLSKTFLIVMLTLSVLQFIRAFLNSIWQQMIYNDMRHDVLARFLQFDMNFFRKYRNGEIISRMTNDLQSAKQAVSGNIILFAKNVIMTFCNITVLFMLSFKLTMAVLCIMPFFTITTMVYTRLSKKFEKIAQQQQADITALADEIVSGVIAVKSFCGEEIELKKFDKQLKQTIALAYRRAVNNGFYQLTSSFFVQLGTLVVLYYGGMLVLDNHDLSPGELASFIFYSIQLSNSSSTISEAYSKIISATGAFEGVLDMLKYEPLVKQNPNAREDVRLQGNIEFHKVTFQYPNTNVIVLNNLSITINQGEYIAFVGASGSGKSTIVQLIERFYDPQSGQVLIDSVNIKDVSIRCLRKQIGLVSQEPTLFEGTIKSNIIYGVKDYTNQDFDWAIRASGVWNFITNSQSFPNGLDTFVGERGHTLSGGQKQRIAIARALIKRPKILVFDEATSALDSESEFQVQSAIDDLITTDRKETTIIVIAHRLSTIVNCSKICVLSNGVIAEWGTHQQLVERNGIYKNLIDRQMQGIMESTQDDSNEEKEE